MKRINIYIANQQIDKLKSRAAKTGIKFSELIRRGIDLLLKQKE